MGGWMHQYIDLLIDWMDGWMDGLMDGWMDCLLVCLTGLRVVWWVGRFDLI